MDPLEVCISATKGKISDEKLFENGTGLPTESWESKASCTVQTQMLMVFGTVWLKLS